MPFDVVNVGTVANDGTGDTPRGGMTKVNANFAKAVEGPASATSGRVAVYNGTTGKLLQDGAKLEADLVVGPSSVTGDRIVLFDSTTGKLIKQASVGVADLLALSGGTMTGAIVTNSQIETTLATLGTSGTITVNLTASMLQTTGTLTGNITSLVTSNRSAGRSATLRIINGSTNRTISYSASWRWVGTKPASGFTLPANKIGILTLTAFGSNETDIVAAWAVEP